MLIYYLNMIDTPADREKFTLIYNEYRHRMKYIAIKMLGNEADAEDALQDSFEKLIKVLPNIREPISDDTAAFLTVIVKNTCKDLLRRNHTFCPLELEKVDPKHAAIHVDMMADINVRAVWEAIERLPSKYHEALLLKYYFELPNKSIASLLGISLQGVYKRLDRAKVQLQEELEKEKTVV